MLHTQCTSRMLSFVSKRTATRASSFGLKGLQAQRQQRYMSALGAMVDKSNCNMNEIVSIQKNTSMNTLNCCCWSTKNQQLLRSFASSSSSLSESDIKKRLDDFQHLFVEARLCIEDVEESMGTKYFDEDAEAAKEAVDEAVAAFHGLIDDIDDPDEKNRILRGSGLKVEQLKGELDLALQGGHDH